MNRLPTLLFLASVTSLFAKVITHPAPSEEKLAPEYVVTADRQPVSVYTARVLDAPFAGKFDYGGPYCFANFDTDGAVEVRIVSQRSLKNAVIRPASKDVSLRLVDDHTAVISFAAPRKVSFEPEGKKGPLLLFANVMETNAPAAGTSGVVYFGPGTHKPERILLTNNQTLYLAGGAVVKGGIIAQGDNIQIRGRGVLDSSDWEWRKGPTPNVISIHGTNVLVEGITIRGASHWTVVPRDSRNVTIANVKICGGRVQNDDGINPCNSRDVLITDCFIRTDDDCVAMKGLKTADGNVEHVTVEKSVLWCDRARIFLLGHESRAPFMRDITLRDLDIVHFTMTAFLFEPGEEMRLENVLVENVRVHGEGQNELIRLKPVVNQYMQTKVPGHVADITFRDVTVSGKPGPYRIQLKGADEAHQVEKVTFERVQMSGAAVRSDSTNVQVGTFVKGVTWR